MTTHPTINELNCKQTRQYLMRYVRRELNVDLRHRVASHLDHCDACYQEMRQQRELTQSLQQQMPRVGLKTAPHFGDIWAAVQEEVRRPRETLFQLHPRRYSMAVIVMVMSFVISLSMSQQSLGGVLPLQPTPRVVELNETYSIDHFRVAMPTAECYCVVTLESAEPTPPVQPQYAPINSSNVVGATQEPERNS